MAVADISNLTVKYGDKVAVSDLTVQVPEGAVGLLGPNGAGKTTLLKALLGFISPSSGTGSVFGYDIKGDGLDIRRQVGLMPEQDCHIPGMNAVSFVAFTGELCGMRPADALRRAHETLQYCGLGEARYRNIETYSTGMKQRIKLAQALVHGPRLLLLDEPTNGLDPDGREEMLGLIRDVSHDKGVNVVVSSHLLPDIERACDHVIVLRQGKVAAEGPIEQLRRSSMDMIDAELLHPSEAFETLIAAKGGSIARRLGNQYRLQAPVPGDQVGAWLFQVAKEADAQVRGFRPAARTLEEVFMEAIE
ncbi:MAG: ABC transporter ATP-binding protein [Armatimonadetes bacterium]|nr:ABC transporter ATP-binding protein [Armatimonadota bacterium]